MKKLAISLVLALLALLATSAMAADVSGNWKSKFETQRGTFERTIVLKQDGEKLTGKIVTQRGETEIENGKVNGDAIEFSAKQRRPNQDEAVVVTYKAKVTGDKMEGTMSMGGGQGREFTATREK